MPLRPFVYKFVLYVSRIDQHSRDCTSRDPLGVDEDPQILGLMCVHELAPNCLSYTKTQEEKGKQANCEMEKSKTMR